MNRTNSLGVIYINTKYDDAKEFYRIQAELDDSVLQDYCVFQIDGDEFPDLATCLNLGIKAAIRAQTEYITWAHPDMHYDDPNWYASLRNTLEAYPEILKLCASNSRDQINDWRIGQEQSWLMRTGDFTLLPWLFFDEQFKGIGGYEDWFQHYQILANGYLVCITPTATVHHKGAESRSKHNTTKEQWANHDTYLELTHSGQAIDPHQPSLFGRVLNDQDHLSRCLKVSRVLKKQLGLCEFSLPPSK